MLTICLRILSILGIVILALLAVAAVILLLVLFVPVTYRIRGEKDAGGLRVSARIGWLLGLVRIRCDYPDPGYLSAKILFFTLYKTKIVPKESPAEKDESRKKAGKSKRRKKSREETQPKTGEAKSQTAKAEEKRGLGSPEKMPIETGNAADGEINSNIGVQKEAGKEEPTDKGTPEEQMWGPGKILQKFQKIKYTIKSICDKIKGIWNNISYYLELLQEEPTRQFLADVRLRMGKMLKSVLPRHIRANIRFGTGSPDTTGYLYGAYCMIFPMPGSKVNLIPDFEEAVFQGEFAISGHVMAAVLVWNLCRVALDRRMRQLIRKARVPFAKESGKKAA